MPTSDDDGFRQAAVHLFQEVDTDFSGYIELAEFVELPEQYSSLAYSNMLCGVLRGALAGAVYERSPPDRRAFAPLPSALEAVAKLHGDDLYRVGVGGRSAAPSSV